jgi:hypothetical protein
MTAAVQEPRPSRAARFKQVDVTRGFKAAKMAGVRIAIEIVRGIASDTMRLVMLTEAEGVAPSGNPLDRWRGKRRAG